MSGSYFANLELPSENSPAIVTVLEDINIYVYDVKALWITYAVATFVVLIAMISGHYAVRRNKGEVFVRKISELFVFMRGFEMSEVASIYRIERGDGQQNESQTKKMPLIYFSESRSVPQAER